MKTTVILPGSLLLVAILAGVSGPSAYADDSSNSKPSESESVFVGNYGEVVRYPADYAADAKMHGPNEVVIFHPRSVELTTDNVAPADFEKLGLFELFVEPKASAGIVQRPDEPSALEALCDRRLQSLDATGYKSEPMIMCDGVSCGIPGINWPKYTCEFDVNAPVRLHQIYTESAGKFFILTSGADFTQPKAARLAISLMESVNPPAPENPRQENKPAPESWSRLKPDIEWGYVWGPICGLLILAMAIPGRWKRRIQRMALVALLFGNSAIALSLLICVVQHLLGVAAVNDLLLLGIGETVLFSAVGLGFSLRQGSELSPGRAAAILIAAVACIGFFSLSLHDPPSPVFQEAAFLSYWIMAPLGLFLGIVSGLASPMCEGRE